MKRQEFQNFDNFKPEDWLPLDNKIFHFVAPDWKFSGEFKYDVDIKACRGEITEYVMLPYPTKETLPRWYINTYAAINNQFLKWNIDPHRVSWTLFPTRYPTRGEFGSTLSELLDPHPSMMYKVCEDDENCFVDSKYTILNKNFYEIELCWKQFIYNDKTKPINLWNKFIELMRKRISVPFTAVLRTPEETEE